MSAQDTYGIHRLEQIDAAAPELAAEWLQAHIDAGDSPYTVQMQRSALRMFHQDRTIGQDVAIPRRRRAAIRRSRGEVAADHPLNLDHYRHLVAFLQATGLRRREAAMLQAEHVGQFGDQVEIHVRNGKGGRERRVRALPGSEDAVRAVVAGKAPEARVFDHLPSALDVHSYRRWYAQALYR